MKYYFKSHYCICNYSPNWYGILEYAPKATILFYDDDNSFCIGFIENIDDFNELLRNGTITGYTTEQEALDEITLLSVDNPNIWFGDRLLNRWVNTEPQGGEKIDG